MPATIHDVAKKAGVGIGTVSSVLNNSRPVNEVTRQKVLAAIEELEYVPNPSGRRLSMGKTHTIGVIIPFFTSQAQIKRLRGVMSVISESEYDINLFAIESEEQRDKVFQTVPNQGRIDGLLIFSILLTEDDVRRIQRHNIPTVLVESYHPELTSICLDDTRAAQEAVAHLLDLGHTKIGYLGEYLDDQLSDFSFNRYQGYCQALEAANLPIKSQYIVECKPTREAGRIAALSMLQQSDKPTAIFAYSDIQALGVLEAARELNLDIPGDLSVVGYDDIDTAHFAQLTTVRQHLFESGVEGVNLLFDTMANPQKSPEKINFPTELIIRRTTSPPKS